MNKNTFYNNIKTSGGMWPVSPVGFFFYRELKTILPNLILSRFKQKLPIELFKTTERACNEFTVLSCDLNILLKVVSGYGMPLIVNKSI